TGERKTMFGYTARRVHHARRPDAARGVAEHSFALARVNNRFGLRDDRAASGLSRPLRRGRGRGGGLRGFRLVAHDHVLLRPVADLYGALEVALLNRRHPRVLRALARALYVD